MATGEISTWLALMMLAPQVPQRARQGVCAVASRLGGGTTRSRDRGAEPLPLRHPGGAIELGLLVLVHMGGRGKRDPSLYRCPTLLGFANGTQS